MAEILDASRQQAGLSHRDLWIGYCAAGGLGGPEVIDAYLDGTVVPSRIEYDVMAQALNDAFVGAGGNHPVPYAEDLSG